jgi:hypothetical protein
MSPTSRQTDVLADIGDAVTKIKNSKRKRQRLTDSDRLFILWGKWKGYSEQRIADALNKSYTCVHSYWQKVNQSPMIILDLECYAILGKKRFRCRFCNDVRETEVKIQRHVLGHCIPYEIARDMNISGARKPL